MINWEKFDEHLHGCGNALILELIGMFLSDYPGNISTLRKNVTERDFQGVDKIAHPLKTNFATFGDMECAKLAFNLELMGKKQTDDNVQLAGVVDPDTWERFSSMAPIKMDNNMNEVLNQLVTESEKLIAVLEDYTKTHAS